MVYKQPNTIATTPNLRLSTARLPAIRLPTTPPHNPLPLNLQPHPPLLKPPHAPKKVIQRTHILGAGLIQLQRGNPSNHRRKHNEQLSVRKILPHARARPLSKRHEIRFEGTRIRREPP